MHTPLTISFDLDGTLLCGSLVWLADPDIPSLVSATGAREDRMRLGAIPLLRGLADDGHQIWIYTQSLRGKREVSGWLKSLGISLAGYVNLPIHEDACEKHGSIGVRPRKSPHLFGINIHVDDDEQVAHECRDTCCSVLVIKPDIVDFEQAVRTALGELEVS